MTEKTTKYTLVYFLDGTVSKVPVNSVPEGASENNSREARQ